MKITILKPDHLGDLVLSAPAINKLSEVGSDVRLFCNVDSVFLANYLFPNIEIHPISFAHLSKNNSTNKLDLFLNLSNTSDALVCLRDDETLRGILSNINVETYITTGSFEIHETIIQRNAIVDLTKNYDINNYFYRYGFKPKKIPKTLSKIGLIISAGFFNNSVSIYKWFEYAKFFIDNFNTKITIIAGPNEKSDALILNHLIPYSNVITGSKDIKLFLDKIEDLDLVIATDSGTSHIVSLSGAPIISLFGASPYKRYHPIGPYNHIVNLNFACSPCPQFAENKVNKCLSKECLNSIQAQDIFEKIEI